MALNWTEEQFSAYRAKVGLCPRGSELPPKQGKHRNKKVETPDGKFDSKGEYQRWCELKMLQKGGKIANLRRQVKFILAASVKLEGKRAKPALRYFADFTYFDRELKRVVVEDFKNPHTAEEPTFRTKLHLMMSVHGIEVKVTMK